MDENQPQDDLIRIQNQFETAWNRYVNLTIGSLAVATIISIGALGSNIEILDARLVFAAGLLISLAIIYFKGFACPRCHRSLMQFRINSKPRFCPHCGVSFTGMPSK
jgi:hypothetical protein